MPTSQAWEDRYEQLLEDATELLKESASMPPDLRENVIAFSLQLHAFNDEVDRKWRERETTTTAELLAATRKVATGKNAQFCYCPVCEECLGGSSPWPLTHVAGLHKKGTGHVVEFREML